jgi:hypothetical protein
MSNATPTWAYIVGILMMLFGGCDGIQSVQQTKTRNLLHLQQNVINNFASPDSGFSSVIQSFIPDSLRSDSAAVDQLTSIQKMSKKMGDMFQMSEYSIKWTERFGYIGLVIAFFYMIGGVFLMVKRPFSIKLAATVLIVNALFVITQRVVLGMDSASASAVQEVTSVSLFGIVIDLVLLVFVLTADNTVYLKNEQPATQN